MSTTTSTTTSPTKSPTKSINYKAELVGVFGYPVSENPTGLMQEAAFQELGLNWRYLTMEVRPEDLPEAMRGLRAMGMRGVNLTIPHKVAVLPLLDRTSPEAELIGAVNTVRREGDLLIGENTDGKGFLRGLREEARLDPLGKRIAILGAGGAARAITVELALAGAAELIVLNRSTGRGRALVAHLTDNLRANARFQPLTQPYTVPEEVDILVNATSIGLFPASEAMPPVRLETARPDLLVCDVVPNPPETRLLQLARRRGLRTLSGLSMLVFQGAIAFLLWTGVPAPEEVMKETLKIAFQAELG